ncbi:class I SAM-dependent methyltransferase [Tunicatimonas pelagia]|uniref:class I SAM-dependent methyltransferase n=1 Tax=Tunicatimonas pelagia TaxID=931531 RepID=UPI0026656E35|nr:class I SAM-dependent methyltransferase [Tunicatimonas pelagia]WKN41989.1 class I SAM-dependent methyltransferase [Tunicatimonas pelagia]
MEYEDNPKSVKYYVKQYLLKNSSKFARKVVIDFPTGSGVTSRILKSVGAHPMPFDIFPEFFEVEGLTCQKADIQEGIPINNHVADYLICQEGIEHFSDQIQAFREFNRVLKPGGELIITTPNYGSLRSRLSYFLGESERYNTLMPPNELDSIWFSGDDNSSDFYLGHIFLMGIQKLRVIARLAGFEIIDIQFTRARPTSTLLLPLFYPLIYLSNLINYRKNLRKKNGIDRKIKAKVYGEIFKLGVNIKLLVDGHLFVCFKKTNAVDQVKSELKKHIQPDELII